MLTYNIGIDCEDLARWQRKVNAAEKTWQRLFYPAEHQYCQCFKDMAPHYAGLWCAKEAVVKTLAPFAKFFVRDVEILSARGQQPQIKLHRQTATWLAPHVRLSITHSKNVAMASAIIVLTDATIEKTI